MYYRHSGKAPLLSLVLGLASGALTGIGLGVVYAYVILNLPIAGYITFLISAGYGALCGLAAALVLKRGKVRHPKLSLLITLVGQALGFYVSWAMWIYALVHKADETVDFSLLDAFNPLVLWPVISKVNEVGAWEMSGTTPTGAFLWILWAAEAILIFGAAYVVAAGVFAGEVFCEPCQQWCETEKAILMLEPTDPTSVKNAFELRRYDGLKRLEEGSHLYSVDLRRCPGCTNTRTVSVNEIIVKLNKEGKPEAASKELFAGLLMKEEEVEKVRALGSAQNLPDPHGS